ncbi:MAG: hypothetical protein SPI30_02150 [Prevotella sp.]|nr:hypothetical protein [Prevotella sp.]
MDEVFISLFFFVGIHPHGHDETVFRYGAWAGSAVEAWQGCGDFLSGADWGKESS